jgi:subtilisin family serine protease
VVRGVRTVGALALMLHVTTAATASSPLPGRLDPYLVPLLTRPLFRIPHLQSAVRDGRLPVLIRTAGDPYALARYGVRVNTVVGDIASVEVPVARMAEVADAPEVRYIEGPRRATPAAPMVTKSVDYVGVPDVRRSVPSYTGKGVIVGLIDTGIDLTHPAFRSPTGATRILAVWDQIVSLPGRNPPEVSYGTEWTAADINAGRAFTVRDSSGHGTHVAGVIAGSGLVSDDPVEARQPHPSMAGVAPDADILLVRTTYLTPDILDAAAYITLRAGEFGMPVVINMGFGNTWGPHDGRGLMNDALQLLVRDQPGRAMVAAAGNEGDTQTHARVTLRPGDPPKRLYFESDFGAETVFVETWQDANTRVRVRPLYPRNTAGELSDFAIAPLDPGQIASNILPAGPVRGLDTLFLYEAPATEFPDQNHLFCYISRSGDYAVALDAYTYALELSGSGTVDAYIHDGSFVLRAGEPDAVAPDGAYSVGSPADADLVVAVTAVATNDSWLDVDGNLRMSPAVALGERSEYASIGPRRDRGEKPDVAAPGDYITAPFSRDAVNVAEPWRISPDGRHVVFRGTSLAAAHVSGMVALLLQQSPAITAGEIRERVRAAARNGVWTPELGMGVSDARQLLGVPRPPQSVRVQVSGGLPLLTWQANPEPDVVSYRVWVDGTARDVGTATQFLASPSGANPRSAYVTAVNRAGRQSAPSETVSLAPNSLAAPRWVRIHGLDSALVIEWSPVDRASQYRLDWGLGPGARGNSAQVAGTRARLEGLANGVVYFLTVAAMDASGNGSPPSEEVRGIPRPLPELPFSEIPIRAGFPIETQHDIIAGPTVADVNGDGRAEIFVAGYDGSVYAFESDGAPLTGWPQDTGAPVLGAVAVGDLDHDGTVEIVAASARRVFAWRANGTRLQGFPLSVPEVVRSGPVLANLDVDPELEVLVTAAEGRAGVYGWNYRGGPLAGFPLRFDDNSYGYSSPVVADSDLDGEPEVYAAAAWGPVYSWTAKGVRRPTGFPAFPDGGVSAHANPVLATLDGGKTLTLLFTGRAAGLVAYSAQGSRLPGFPAALTTDSDAAVSVGDIDGDGRPEILVADGLGLVHAFHVDGKAVEGFPVELGDVVETTPLVADLDGDRAGEILVVSHNRRYPGSVLFFLRGDGTVLNFVKADVNIVGTPTLADLDGDGRAELIVTTLRRPEDLFLPAEFPALGGRLFVWDLPYEIHRSDWTTHLGASTRLGVAPFDMPAPSDMSTLSAVRSRAGVRISWTTTRERGNLGWRVLRAESPDGPFVPVLDFFVRAKAAYSDKTTSYLVEDRKADPAKAFYYRLQNYGSMNRERASPTLRVGTKAEATLVTQWGAMKRLVALPPFPSPANPEAWIPFVLGEAADVTVRVLDVRGEVVRTLHLGALAAGDYSTRARAAHWNGRNDQGETAASGLYFVEVQADAVRGELHRILLRK